MYRVRYPSNDHLRAAYEDYGPRNIHMYRDYAILCFEGPDGWRASWDAGPADTRYTSTFPEKREAVRQARYQIGRHLHSRNPGPVTGSLDEITETGRPSIPKATEATMHPSWLSPASPTGPVIDADCRTRARRRAEETATRARCITILRRMAKQVDSAASFVLYVCACHMYRTHFSYPIP